MVDAGMKSTIGKSVELSTRSGKETITTVRCTLIVNGTCRNSPTTVTTTSMYVTDESFFRHRYLSNKHISTWLN